MCIHCLVDFSFAQIQILNEDMFKVESTGTSSTGSSLPLNAQSTFDFGLTFCDDGTAGDLFDSFANDDTGAPGSSTAMDSSDSNASTPKNVSQALSTMDHISSRKDSMEASPPPATLDAEAPSPSSTLESTKERLLTQNKSPPRTTAPVSSGTSNSMKDVKSRTGFSSDTASVTSTNSSSTTTTTAMKTKKGKT